MSESLLDGFGTHERWLREALREAALAAEDGEVPVGAVVVRDGQILGRGRNQVERLQDATAHAEIIALGAASGQTGSWRLDGATLYVTLEPCIMCCGAALLSRVENVVFGAVDPRAGGVVSRLRLLQGNPYRQPVTAVGGILAQECSDLLQAFFRRRRAEEQAGEQAGDRGGEQSAPAD